MGESDPHTIRPCSCSSYRGGRRDKYLITACVHTIVAGGHVDRQPDNRHTNIHTCIIVYRHETELTDKTLTASDRGEPVRLELPTAALPLARGTETRIQRPGPERHGCTPGRCR